MTGHIVTGHRATGRRRPWMTTAGIAVVVAVMASLLVLAMRTRAADPADDGALALPDDGAGGIDLPRAGMVVSLSRPGFVELPAALGRENAFVASVSAEQAVVAIELVAGAEVVDRIVPANPSPGRADRLTWFAERSGPVTLVARAYDGNGNVGQSNPVRVDVRRPEAVTGYATATIGDGETLGGVAQRFGADAAAIARLNALGDLAADTPLPPGATVTVPVTLPTSGTPAASVQPDVSMHPAAYTPAVRALPPMPDGLSVAPAPTLGARVEGCNATVDSVPGAPSQHLVLLATPAGGGAFLPVMPVGTGSSTLRMTTGEHDVVLAAGENGALVAWSPPVTVTVTDAACSGWTGNARLDGSRLVAETAADTAYLYLSTTPTGWTRVPATGVVGRGPDGFDFAGLLPPTTGGPVKIEAWGRTNGALAPIGSGSFTPPAPGGPTVGVGGPYQIPDAKLWWLRPADWKHNGEAPEAVTDGEVDDPTVLEFQWSAPIPGVTHGIVQVTRAPVPGSAGPNPGGVLYQATVAGHAGTFDIDFATVVAAYKASLFSASAGIGVGNVNVGNGSSAYQAMAPSGGPVMPGEPGAPTTSAATSSPHPIDLDPLDDLDVQESDLKQLFVVRVVPMVNDSWTGLRSNDVNLTVDTGSLVPVAPAGAKPYDLDVSLVAPPRPPDPNKLNCWQFTGWSDQAQYQQHLADEAKAASSSLSGVNLGDYTVWTQLVSAVGSGPICAGCYVMGSLHMGIGGATCSDSSFLGDLFEAFKTLVNMLSSTFAFIKAQIVDLVVSATGCKAAGSAAADICTKLATAALDTALVSLGIPPSLPNWDQLVSAAEGDIVELGVGVAEQLGVPCDEASFAADVSGQKGLTCEAALHALLDEAKAQIDQLYADTSTAMGFEFPSLMKVRPHPVGQVGPAVVKVTVNPTKYTTAEKGITCKAAAFASSSWSTKPLVFGQPGWKSTGGAIVSGGIVPHDFAAPDSYQIPSLSWAGVPFEVGDWTLPDLPLDPNAIGEYLPASRTYNVYPPVGTDPVQVAELHVQTKSTAGSTEGAQETFVQPYWQKWPRHVFLFNSAATFKVVVTSPCAPAEVHSWTIPGFGPGLPVEQK